MSEQEYETYDEISIPVTEYNLEAVRTVYRLVRFGQGLNDFGSGIEPGDSVRFKGHPIDLLGSIVYALLSEAETTDLDDVQRDFMGRRGQRHGKL